jgi:hypothetical protein
MDPETQEALRVNYDGVANLHASWLFVADNLLLASRLLTQSFALDISDSNDYERANLSTRLLGPILMLRGCALECLLKGLFVAEGKILGEGGRFLSPGGRSHDLVELASKTSFNPTATEGTLLAYLGHFITQGRYPIPKRAPEGYAVRADGARREIPWIEQDEREYHALVGRLRTKVLDAARAAGRT